MDSQFIAEKENACQRGHSLSWFPSASINKSGLIYEGKRQLAPVYSVR